MLSIVGKYRTGKSFLMNRVILDTKTQGFQVGSTINSCTKGLWMWNKPMQLVNHQLTATVSPSKPSGRDNSNKKLNNNLESGNSNNYIQFTQPSKNN